MRRNRRWSELALWFMQMLWRCPCQYSNVATSRCYGCGSRPPRELRQAVAAEMAAAEGQRGPVTVPGAR